MALYTDDAEVRFVLDWHAELDFDSASSLIPSQPVFVLSI
jgi:hypothetical protein